MKTIKHFTYVLLVVFGSLEFAESSVILPKNQQEKNCNPLNSTVEPRVKTDKQKDCYFPFLYNGTMYHDCAPSTEGQICSTTCNYPTDQELGNCQWEKKNLLAPSCENITNAKSSQEPKTVDGTKCVFPFVFNKTCYNDCTNDGSYKLWCGTTPSVDIYPKSYSTCYYTLADLNQPSCANLNQSKPSKHPELFKQNSMCTFPFMYEGKCYNDCILLDNDDYWCAFTKGYLINEWSYCKYLRDVKNYESYLKYGIYSIHSNCDRNSCERTIVGKNQSIESLVYSVKNSSQYAVLKWEVLPQPNNSVLIRTPRACPPNKQLTWKFSSKGKLILDNLQQFKFNTQFILNRESNGADKYSLLSVIGNQYQMSYVGIRSQDDSEMISVEKPGPPTFFTFKLEKELNINEEEDLICFTTTIQTTTQTTAQTTLQTTALRTAQMTAGTAALMTIQTTTQTTMQKTAQMTAETPVQTTGQTTIQTTAQTTMQKIAQTTAPITGPTSGSMTTPTKEPTTVTTRTPMTVSTITSIDEPTRSSMTGFTIVPTLITSKTSSSVSIPIRTTWTEPMRATVSTPTTALTGTETVLPTRASMTVSTTSPTVLPTIAPMTGSTIKPTLIPSKMSTLGPTTATTSVSMTTRTLETASMAATPIALTTATKKTIQTLPIVKTETSTETTTQIPRIDPSVNEKISSLQTSLSESINTVKTVTYVTVSASVGTLIVTLAIIVVICRSS